MTPFMPGKDSTVQRLCYHQVVIWPAKEGILIAAVLSALCLIGCRSSEDRHLTNVFPPPGQLVENRPSPLPESLIAIGDQVDKLAGKYVTRVSFLPREQRELVRLLGNQISALKSIPNDQLVASPRAPFAPAPELARLRLLQRAAVWRIEQSSRDGRFETSVGDVIGCHKLGAVLCSGFAIDADLGFAMMNDARKAIAPHLSSLGAAQLQELHAALRQVLEELPSLAQVVQNEGLQSLANVQHVMDKFKSGGLESLTTALGPNVEDAVAYLRRLKGKSFEEQEKYFQGFANEAHDLTSYLLESQKLNRHIRAQSKPYEPKGERPWKRFSRPLLRAMEPLLDVRDKTLCRTRLFAIEAWALSIQKSTGRAPSSIKSLSAALIQDPFTGNQLAYTSKGGKFRAYSFGDDFADDLGETNVDFEKPDFTIERTW